MIESTVVITYKGKPVHELSHAELLRAFYVLLRSYETMKSLAYRTRSPSEGSIESIIESLFGKKK